jgi:hypothetical protein
MAIAVDARTTGARTLAGDVNSTTMSWAHTLGALSNGILIVCLQQDANAATTSVVWDPAGANEALTLKGTISQGAARAEIWYLKSPSGTGSKTITATWSGTHHGCGGSASYSGVDQSTTFNAASPQTATGAIGTDPSLAITSANGELVIDSAVWDLAGVTNFAPTKVGGSQNYIAAGVNAVDTSISGSSSDQASTGASVTLQWTGDTVPASAWGQVGVSLIPASAGGRTTKNTRAFPLGVEVGMNWRS